MSMTFLSSEIPSYSVVKSLSFGNFLSLGIGMFISLRSYILSSFLYAYLYIQCLFKTFQFTCPWPPLFLNDPWAVILFCTSLVISLFSYNFPQYWIFTSTILLELYLSYPWLFSPLRHFESLALTLSLVMLFTIIIYTLVASISYLDAYIILVL